MPAGPPLLRAALLVILVLLLFLGAPPARGAVYTNHFLVELRGGGQAEADRVAAEHGFGGVRKLPFLESGYFFYHNGIPKARRRRSLQHKLRLEKDSRVRKAVQQEGFSRRKRGYRDINDIDINMNDPLFTKQWYLINTGQADGTPGLDLNVAEAWELGYTGKGVTIGIMDDGIDYLHPDLASNYNVHIKPAIFRTDFSKIQHLSEKESEVTRAAYEICLIKEENSSRGGWTLQISVHCFKEKPKRANGDFFMFTET